MVSLIHRESPRRSRTRRDFATTSYRAPDTVRQLSRAYNERPRSSWLRWAWIAFVLLLLGGAASAIASPLFTIQNVIIDNVPSTDTEQQMRSIVNTIAESKRWWVLPQSNLLFFSTAAARQAIGSQFYLQGITISRQWPNVLRVSLPPDTIIGVVQNNGTAYMLDMQGVAIQVAPNQTEPDTTLVNIHEINAPLVQLGQPVVSTALAQFVADFTAGWAKTLPKLTLSYLEVDPANLPTMRAITSDGWYAYISGASDASTQVEAIQRLLNDKIRTDESRLDYLDVRFGSKVYYKLK